MPIRLIFHRLVRVAPAALLAALLAAPPLAAQDRLISAAEQLRVDAIFSAYAQPGSPGCIVGVNERGDARVRAAYGLADIERGVPMRPGMLSEVGSVSKQFTAAALVLLEQDGRLSLDEDVRKYWPTFPDFGQRVTLRHLLNHTSGVRDQFGLLDLVGRPSGEVVHTVGEVVEILEGQRTLNFPVGSAYLYSNTGYTFGGALVAKLSGQSFAAFTTERLLRPAGLDRAVWRTDFRVLVPDRVLAYSLRPRGGWALDLPFSELHGSGGLLMTVDEMLRWTELLNADRIGQPGTLRSMTRVGVLTDGTPTEYGLGLMVRNFRGVREIAHSGSTAGYRAYLAHYPDYGLSVAMQCNAGNANYVELGRRVAEHFLADRMRPVEPTVATPTPATRGRYAVAPTLLAAFAGLYHDAETGADVRITPADSAVEFSYGLGRRVRLVPVAEDSLEGGGRAIRIVRDPDGTPIGLYYHAGRVRNIRFDRVQAPH